MQRMCLYYKYLIVMRISTVFDYFYRYIVAHGLIRALFGNDFLIIIKDEVYDSLSIKIEVMRESD